MVRVGGGRGAVASLRIGMPCTFDRSAAISLAAIWFHVLALVSVECAAKQALSLFDREMWPSPYPHARFLPTFGHAASAFLFDRSPYSVSES